MRILLTNDDGIYGEGLLTLASALKKAGHTVFVVAPDCNNSAVGHKITMRNSMKLEKKELPCGAEAYALGGSPADCVLIALRALKFNPDLVISGINYGANTGSDVMYSGTVAAAMEGAQNGIPSIALSLSMHGKSKEEMLSEFPNTANTVLDYLDDWVQKSKEIEGVLNVNIPFSPKGMKYCRCSKLDYNTAYCEDSEGFRMSFDHTIDVKVKGDLTYLDERYITVTPLLLDRTDYEVLKKWQEE